MPTTDVFSWTYPTVGGSSGTWGQEIVDLVDNDIESTVNTVKTTADAALPKAGGTMTGNLKLLTESYTTVDKGSISGSVTFDIATANYFYATVTGDITSMTLSNWPASGDFAAVIIELANGGGSSITWAASIVWDGGTVPTLQSSGTDLISLVTRDGGTTVRGEQVWTGST